MRIKIQSIGDVLLCFLIISIYCFDGSSNLNKILFIVAALFMVFVIYYSAKRNNMTIAFFSEFIPFVLFCFVSCFWSYNSSVSLGRSVTLVQNMVLFGLLYSYVVNCSKQELLMKALSYAGVIFSFYIVVYYGGIYSFISLMKVADPVNRIGGDVAHLSQIGQSLCISGITTFGLFLFENGKVKKILYLLLYLIQLLVILAAQSRTGLALLLLGSIFILLSYKKTVKIKKWIFGLMCALLVVIVFLKNIDLSMLTGRWDGLISIVKGGKTDSSTQSRLFLINEGLDLFFSKPIGGFGIATSGRISSQQTYFHNNYVELLATVGLLGFCCFYFPYIKQLYLYIRNKQKNKVFLISFSLLIIQLVLMVATVTYYVKYQYIALVLIMSCSEKVKDGRLDEK